ncbi:MAG: TetR/AcrR family transcriptional regulator C-terminal domain-containing protein [Clostridiales bacterium]|nr:TetR/AcrR family transcriptional regulator C-terminal domain-containing protein [Clostridiales bacterium]
MPANTKQLIKDTFITLLEDRPLSQITVKDIVASAGINRNSFYYHYEDLPSLIESIVMDEADRLACHYHDIDSLESCLSIAIEFALANRKLALHLFNSSNRDIFEQYFLKISEDVIRKYFNDLFGDLNISDRDKEILITYYKSLIFGLIINWMQTGMTSDIKNDFARLTEIYSGIPEEIVRRIST